MFDTNRRMSPVRRAFAVLAAASIALLSHDGARPARADELHLRWNECALGGGLAQRVSGCNNPLAVEHLLAGFELSAAVDSVVALEIVIDVVVESASLPSWWQFQPGGCNAGALTASADFSGFGACADPFESQAVALVQTWAPGQPRGASNTSRLIVTSSVLASQRANLGPATPYYAADVRFAHSRSSGAGVCSGCPVPGCLVLNSVQLIRHPGAVPASVFVQASGSGSPNWAAWQGSFSECALVPARNTTWGAIKSLYR